MVLSKKKFFISISILIIIIFTFTLFTGFHKMAFNIASKKSPGFTNPNFTLQKILLPSQKTVYIKRGYFAFTKGPRLYMFSTSGLENYLLNFQVGLFCLPKERTLPDGTNIQLAEAYLDISQLPYPPEVAVPLPTISQNIPKGEIVILIMHDSTTGEKEIESVGGFGCSYGL